MAILNKQKEIWCYFDSDASNYSHNVSSVIDSGVGETTINFAFNLPSSSYVVTGITKSNSGANNCVTLGTSSRTPSSIKVYTHFGDYGLFDWDNNCIYIKTN